MTLWFQQAVQHSSALAHRSAQTHRSPMLKWLMGLGGIGLFGVSIIDSSIIPLPLPGSTDLLLLLLTSNRANPWLMAALAIVGSLIGGYITWKAGRKGGQAMLGRYVSKRFSSRVTAWVEHHGSLSLAISAILPPPIPLLPFLLAAGALGVTKKQFFVSMSIARTLRYGFVAWLGATYGRIVVRWWSRYLAKYSDVILWTYLGLLAAGIAYGFWKYSRDRRVDRGDAGETVRNAA